MKKYEIKSFDNTGSITIYPFLFATFGFFLHYTYQRGKYLFVFVMDLNEEKKLIQKAKKDPEVFGQLYDKYYPQIFGYVLKRVANLEIAQDVTSETFFKALRKLWQFRWQNVPFSCWLYRIANNEIANYFRKNRIKTVPLENVPEPISVHNPETEVMKAEKELEKYQDFLTLHETITQLSIKYQEVITLRFFEKKKIREMSQILGRKEGTIKSQIHRAIKELKKLIIN